MALTWGVIAISVSVIVIISALVAGAVWRRPGTAAIPGSRSALEPPVEALNWLWVGVGVSTLVLLFTVIWTMMVLAKVTSPIAKPALTIEVTGRNGGGRSAI